MNPSQSLSPTELDELQDFLDGTPGAMPFHETMGYLTGVVSAPSMFMPSTWLPKILGDNEFDTLEEAREVHGLIMRLYNQLSGDLNSGHATHPSDSLSDPDVALWCEGYLSLTREDPIWLSDKYAVALLLPFGVIAGQFDLAEESDTDGNPIEDPDAYINTYREKLSGWVSALHKQWADWRRDQMQPTPSPAPQKIGRNEKCLCGSGRKFKKCCGR